MLLAVMLLVVMLLAVMLLVVMLLAAMSPGRCCGGILGRLMEPY